MTGSREAGDQPALWEDFPWGDDELSRFWAASKTSGSGKSTAAEALLAEIFRQGRLCDWGDRRHGHEDRSS
jgi:hypothetical protein